MHLSNVNGKPLRYFDVRCWNNGDSLGSEQTFSIRATSATDAELDLATSNDVPEFDNYDASESDE